jgi:hypothetical protein
MDGQSRESRRKGGGEGGEGRESKGEKEEKRKKRERSPPQLDECCSNPLLCSSPSTRSAVVVNGTRQMRLCPRLQIRSGKGGRRGLFVAVRAMTVSKKRRDNWSTLPRPLAARFARPREVRSEKK